MLVQNNIIKITIFDSISIDLIMLCLHSILYTISVVSYHAYKRIVECMHIIIIPHVHLILEETLFRLNIFKL